MTAECDGFFDDLDILFEPSSQDDAVYAVRSADFYDPAYKKFLIQCWFDVTYGTYTGSRFDLKDSRVQMSRFLATTKYVSFEELINDQNGG